MATGALDEADARLAVHFYTTVWPVIHVYVLCCCVTRFSGVRKAPLLHTILEYAGTSSYMLLDVIARLQAVVNGGGRHHAMALFNLGKLHWLRRGDGPEHAAQCQQYLLKVPTGLRKPYIFVMTSIIQLRCCMQR